MGAAGPSGGGEGLSSADPSDVGPLWLLSDRQRLFENLRMLPHTPGVQMQPIPEDAVPEDSGDEDEEDPDKRISSEYRRTSWGLDEDTYYMAALTAARDFLLQPSDRESQSS